MLSQSKGRVRAWYESDHGDPIPRRFASARRHFIICTVRAVVAGETAKDRGRLELTVPICDAQGSNGKVLPARIECSDVATRRCANRVRVHVAQTCIH